jgi:hypothetical protein
MKQRRYEIFGHGDEALYAGKKLPRAEAEAAKAADFEAITKRLGREWTHRERDNGMVEALRDHRKPEQQLRDSVWQPKLQNKAALSPKEKAVQHAEDALEQERLDRMSPAEKNLFIARRELEREHDATLSKEREAAHLEKAKGHLDYVENLYDLERWNPKADAGFRQVLEMAERQMRLVDGDPIEAKRLLHRIDEVVEARRVDAEFQAKLALEEAQERHIRAKEPIKRLAQTWEVTDLDTKRAALTQDFLENNSDTTTEEMGE